MNLKLLKYAFFKTLPIMSGYVVLGIGFGILSVQNGYGILWALAMSLFIYAGSMQYVAVGLLASGASLITTALTTLMVNARHLFYGISMIERYKDVGKTKPYLIFALTDETYSLVCNEEKLQDEDRKKYYFFVSLMNQMYWVLGSVLGAVIGTSLPFDVSGIEFSMTAFFVTVFVEQWMNTKNHMPALVGVFSTWVCLAIFGRDNFLIPSMLMIIMILSFARKWMEPKEGEGKND